MLPNGIYFTFLVCKFGRKIWQSIILMSIFAQQNRAAYVAQSQLKKTSTYHWISLLVVNGLHGCRKFWSSSGSLERRRKSFLHRLQLLPGLILSPQELGWRGRPRSRVHGPAWKWSIGTHKAYAEIQKSTNCNQSEAVFTNEIIMLMLCYEMLMFMLLCWCYVMRCLCNNSS